MAKNARPEIFRYHDYREYLKDWLAHCKASQSSLSLRAVATKAGMAVSNLSMILSGSRKLSSKAVFKLGPALGLNRRELAYLEILVLLGNASTQEERVEAFERLNRFRVYRRRNEKESEVFRYMTHWYYPAIREMSALEGFRPEPGWIRDKLHAPLGLGEVEAALEFLTDHGFIEKLPDGSVRPPSKPLDCLGGVYKMALIQFHREMLALAGRAIDTTPPERRNIVGYTLAVDENKLARLQHLVTQVYDEVRSLSQETDDSASGKSVYHLELALFPLTKA
jgi:uncharacterized protein (TIGR02147 family)